MKTKRQLKEEPKANEGYCYIVIYSTGTVKGGKTTNIKHRIYTHKKDGLRHGIHVEHVFVTSPHDTYHETEEKLLAILSEKCTGRIGEYFQGIDIKYSIQAINMLGLSINKYEDMFEDNIIDLLEIETSSMKHLNVLLPDELLMELNAHARSSGMNKKKIVEIALIEYFNELDAYSARELS